MPQHRIVDRSGEDAELFRRENAAGSLVARLPSVTVRFSSRFPAIPKSASGRSRRLRPSNAVCDSAQVCRDATPRDDENIVAGNVIGSNICNMLCVLAPRTVPLRLVRDAADSAGDCRCRPSSLKRWSGRSSSGRTAITARPSRSFSSRAPSVTIRFVCESGGRRRVPSCVQPSVDASRPPRHDRQPRQRR